MWGNDPQSKTLWENCISKGKAKRWRAKHSKVFGLTSHMCQYG